MNEPSPLVVSFVLVRRELVRFARQPARIAAAVGTPVLVWLLLASGLADSFRPAGFGEMPYGVFMWPGVMILIAVFASVFSSISIIEDRSEGWLQSVLASPAPRWSIALGQIVGGAILAWGQAAVLMLAAPLLDVDLGAGQVAAAALALALTSLGTTALGLAFAWRSETAASFHAVMNLVFFPMWMLSSALFPLGGAASWLRWIMWINPLTWCTEAVRGSLLGQEATAAMVVAAGYAAAMTVVAALVIGRSGPP